jgi:hypothetical protein
MHLKPKFARLEITHNQWIDFLKKLRQMVFPNSRQSFKSLGNANRIHLKMVQRHQGKRKSIWHLKTNKQKSKKTNHPS